MIVNGFDLIKHKDISCDPHTIENDHCVCSSGRAKINARFYVSENLIIKKCFKLKKKLKLCLCSFTIERLFCM